MKKVGLLFLLLLFLRVPFLFSSLQGPSGVKVGTTVYTNIYNLSERKNIEELQPGDLVIAYDFEKQCFCSDRVKSVELRASCQLFQVSVGNQFLQEDLFVSP